MIFYFSLSSPIHTSYICGWATWRVWSGRAISSTDTIHTVNQGVSSCTSPFIWMPSHERHGVSNYHEVAVCSRACSWLTLTTQSTSRLCVTGPLWRESAGYRWIPLTKGQCCGSRMMSRMLLSSEYTLLTFSIFIDARCASAVPMDGLVWWP